MNEELTYVYLMSNHQYNFHKIGFSNDPERRLTDLNVPFALELLCRIPCSSAELARDLEQCLHGIYREKQVTGLPHLEWFRDIDRQEFTAHTLNQMALLVQKNERERADEEAKRTQYIKQLEKQVAKLKGDVSESRASAEKYYRHWVQDRVLPSRDQAVRENKELLKGINWTQKETR
jgi:Meiotically up-regulated gene 113